MLKINSTFSYQLILLSVLIVYGLAYNIKHRTHFNQIDDNELYEKKSKSHTQPHHQISLLKSYMNQSADPCEDFHQYACGNWKKHFTIPDDYAVFNIFSVIKDEFKALISDILTENQKNIQDKSDNINFDIYEQIDIFYRSCMDTETINQLGSKPIIQFLKENGGFPLLDGDDWRPENYRFEDVLALQSVYQSKVFFNSDITNDLKNTTTNVIYLQHYDLGLENPDDYLQSYNKPHLDGYRNLMTEVFELLNASKTEIPKVIEEIIDLETKLANITYEGYDTVEGYDAQTIDELNKNYPKFNWTEYLEKIYNINLNNDVKVIIFGVPRTKEIFDILMNTDKRIIANYISWRTVQQKLNYLDERFVAARHKLTKVLTGSDESKIERKLICAEAVRKNIGMGISALYVEKFFDEKSKDDVSNITQSLLNAFRDNLKSYDWISNETKRLAEIKLNKMSLSVGYPDFILNKTKLNQHYEGLYFKNSKYFENILKINQFETIQQKQKFNTKADKLEWVIIPAEINAFYELHKNRIIFPAAILQPPIYHANFPKSLNLGGLGFFIGHEMTHGFDTNGRFHDADGSINNWWDDESSENFSDRADCFIDQYGEFKINNKTLNGDLSSEENVADNGGLRLSYKVFKDWLSIATEDEKRAETIAELNLSPEKIFFIAFAQSWCEYIRPEAVENLIGSDPHPPGKFRILGPLQNFEEFSKVYQCPLNSTMNPAKKCKLW